MGRSKEAILAVAVRAAPMAAMSPEIAERKAMAQALARLLEDGSMATESVGRDSPTDFPGTVSWSCRIFPCRLSRDLFSK